MSSIITAVFEATIGLLVNKVRDEAAERLREGDVLDQQFRGLIVRELDDIKSKLDGLSRKDLLASISFFKEGIELLYVVFDEARGRNEGGQVQVEAACAKTTTFVEEMRKVELDEPAMSLLANAKKRFEQAREVATIAFSNKALSTSDRILAMKYRVMATILETVDNPAEVMATCRVCIEELNCLPVVKSSFNVQLRKSIMAVRALFSKKDRRKIISSVCHLNRVFFDISKAFGKDYPFWMWPAVDTGEGCIDPLRDRRIVNVLRKQDMEHCFVAPWSFGQEGGKEHDLIHPCAIAANSKEQFIIGDNGDQSVKVLDSRGQYINHFRLPGDGDQDLVKWHDVASDMNDNIYALVELYKTRVEGSKYFVCKLNYTGELLHKFLVKARGDDRSRFPSVHYDGLKVNTEFKVMVRSSNVISVYENDGQFVCSFAPKNGPLFLIDFTCACNGRVTLMDCKNVYVYSELGEHLSEFKIEHNSFSRIAFHNSSEHVVIAVGENNYLYVKIYTKDGEFVRNTQIAESPIYYNHLRGVAVTTEGRIAVLCNQQGQWKVLIV